MSNDLGKILVKNKHFSKALFIFKRILKNKPNDLRANFQMGKIYYELNDLNKSVIFFQKCNEIQKKTPNIIFNLALALQSIGKTIEAKGKYLELISINSKDIKSYYGLCSLDIKNITSELYENLKIIYETKDISLFEKSLINFIFSKIEKNKKNYKNEIEYLKLSHQQCYESNLYLNNQSDFYYKNIMSKHCDIIKYQGQFVPLKNFNDSKNIFIVGLPRSGSSLVETIICHNTNNIHTFGEFHGINTSILSQIGKIIYSENFNHQNYKLEINKKIFQESLIEKYKNFETNIFLDKSLENFFHIETILQFFPNAKFIHTYRNINDAVIGIYQTMLPKLSWSHKIEDILNYINLYKNTIKFFKKKYHDKIIDIDLIKLTNQKETEVKKLLTFCEIKINKNYLEYDTNDRLFNKTNSFLQVRNKIKKYEVNKYKPYYHLIKK